MTVFVYLLRNYSASYKLILMFIFCLVSHTSRDIFMKLN